MPEVVPYILAALAFVAVFIALWSHRWPKVEGRVDISIFDPEWQTEVSGPQITFERRGTHHLAYTYTVGGETFQSSRIAPIANLEWQLSGSPDTSSARDDSRWYREGGTVAVYYCPFLPRWSCLEPGGFMVAALLALIGGILYFIV